MTAAPEPAAAVIPAPSPAPDDAGPAAPAPESGQPAPAPKAGKTAPARVNGLGRMIGPLIGRLGEPTQAVAAFLLVVSFPVALVGAVLPSWWVLAAGTVAAYVAEGLLHRSESPLVRILRKARFGLSLRMTCRHLTVVGLVALALDGTRDDILRTSVVALFAVQSLQAAFAVAMRIVVKRRQLPVVTRNIDLRALRIGNGPAPALMASNGELVLFFDVFAVAGTIAAAATRSTLWAVAGAAVTLALLGLCCLALLPHVLGRRGPISGDAALTWLDRWVREYRPTTVLYFSGSLDSAYQAAMWLEPLARLDAGERPLVLLRESALVPQLETTALPIVCVPSAVHLMNLDLSTVRVALYPANVGKNIHLLRVPHIKHVFIGHGDSDKLASVNPFSKAYDEVWTAGKAGRDRYALAEVGVRQEDLVEVGRPQLNDVRRDAPETAVPTVLYAPTWEGWTNDPGNTSVLTAGENIVKRLLAADPPVRVLYKPHPFTGTVNRKAGAAHRRIVALIEAANERREPAGAPAAPELARIEAELAKLTAATRSGADEAERARDGQVGTETMDRIRALRAEWSAAYWAACPADEHRVIEGAGPDLFSCFNQCHLMISDISSVVSDFVASRKPYAITDSAGLGAEEFRRRNTAARAAYVLGPKGDGVDDLVAVVRGERADDLAGARKELKEYLLGADEPDSQTRFGLAIRDLARRADERLERLSDVEGMRAEDRAEG